MESTKSLADIRRYEKMQYHERLAFAQGFSVLAGIDEAGRGPLAGPVVAAACILSPNRPVYGLNDSKKLTPAKRKRLFQELLSEAVDFSIAEVSPEQIDALNIYQATCQAMSQTVAKLKNEPDLLLIDAVELKNMRMQVWPIVRGDGMSISIAAASILAKVTRDRIMEEYDQVYPGYGFAQHKGYGTPGHYDALLKLGPCPIHRRTFLRTIEDKLLDCGLIEPEFFLNLG